MIKAPRSWTCPHKQAVGMPEQQGFSWSRSTPEPPSGQAPVWGRPARQGAGLWLPAALPPDGSVAFLLKSSRPFSVGDTSARFKTGDVWRSVWCQVPFLPRAFYLEDPSQSSDCSQFPSSARDSLCVSPPVRCSVTGCMSHGHAPALSFIHSSVFPESALRPSVLCMSVSRTLGLCSVFLWHFSNTVSELTPFSVITRLVLRSHVWRWRLCRTHSSKPGRGEGSSPLRGQCFPTLTQAPVPLFRPQSSALPTPGACWTARGSKGVEVAGERKALVGTRLLVVHFAPVKCVTDRSCSNSEDAIYL